LITLIRHGQAGSRLVYDDLSALGREQARALGKWFRDCGIHFDALVTGKLNRQIATAEEIVAAMAAEHPDPVVDPRWSEFDLDEVYAGIGPLLAGEDEQFRLQYVELQRDMADPESSAHRAWRHCDVMVVKAWIEGRFEFAGESFAGFETRVHEALLDLPSQSHVAVVTSATPIALSAGAALDLTPGRVMQLAGAQRNTAFTEIDLRRGDLRLVSFNNIPHLREQRMLTTR
jgi:broad specificity phosphatase PhoE